MKSLEIHTPHNGAQCAYFCVGVKPVVFIVILNKYNLRYYFLCEKYLRQMSESRFIMLVGHFVE
jgi:hypothetical protein